MANQTEKDDKWVIRELAGGARIRLDGDGMGGELVTFHANISSTQINRLVREGWLVSLPNSGSLKLSDEGLKSFLRSTDELGNGKLIPPKEQSQVKSSSVSVKISKETGGAYADVREVIESELTRIRVEKEENR